MIARRPLRKRAGFTLVEMLITITAGSSIMLTAVTLVHKALQLHSTTQQRVERTTMLNRFADRFRRDVNIAIAIESDCTQSMAIRLSDNINIHYSFADNLIKRDYVEREQHQIEQVLLSENATGQFAVNEEFQTASLDVIVKHETGGRKTELHIVAAVAVLSNRDNSLAAVSRENR